MKNAVTFFTLIFMALFCKSQSWSSLGIGVDQTTVFTLHTDTATNLLYVGGSFQNAGGNTVNYVASWNGTNWSSLGTGMNFHVHALEMYNGELYAGGLFNFAGGNPIAYLAKWNGTSWDSVSSLVNSDVYTLKAHNGALYGVGLNANIFKWDGTNLTYIQPIPNNIVYCLESYGSDLVAGGRFTSASGNTVNYIAKWDGTAWSAIGNGFNGYVWSLKSFNGDLYAGGEFTFTGGTPAKSIARWNGSTWQALGTGVDCSGNYSNVTTITTLNNVVYAAGTCCNAGVQIVNHIAQWNGVAWSSMANGMSNSVNSLETFQNNLYAGGQFDHAGGVLVNYIAKWNLPTSINAINKTNLEIYPNPFKDKLFLKDDEFANRKLFFQITDIYGKEMKCIYNFYLSTIEVETGVLPRGVYFVKVWNENDIIGVSKIIAY